ncbi:Fe(III) ABC-type transporter, ATP-binding protein [Desulfamplus magnetovallimortis]|uniref:Fe(III) ABC-type transporter, ATP-binding protein n=1 Tax=Desulfamplus magnetovallimortis TaxID=1246637 RepID=A0A1W1HCM2_9BACT|nr:ABC transporter ATP-binding protein [Desulfamplus magnetovallimortis]SLM30244.1 Fe(III) ABC-type transporter, ATP-binding protein [Desulfamplus magnetovallimortis]
MPISVNNLFFSYGDRVRQIAQVKSQQIPVEKIRGDEHSLLPPEDACSIRGIDLDFNEGCFYSILGPNGCGKTTFIDLLIGHLRPASGNVFLQGKDIASLSRLDIAKQVALVAQNDTVNFPFTVQEVVMMGRHPYIKRFSMPSSKDVALVKDVMERTGVDRFASRKITELSGGERQRALFARALCQDTPFLFLDEAFSNMDIHHTIRLLDIVREDVLEKGRGVISVFHDINLAAIWSDILVFMKQGEIVSCGKTKDIMDEQLIEDVFHVKPKVEYNSYARSKQASFRSEITTMGKSCNE